MNANQIKKRDNRIRRQLRAIREKIELLESEFDEGREKIIRKEPNSVRPEVFANVLRLQRKQRKY